MKAHSSRSRVSLALSGESGAVAVIQNQRIAIGRAVLEFQHASVAVEGRPTLVFLHEGLGSIALWRDFPAALAQRTGCRTLVYSREGNGFSDPLTATRIPRYMHHEALEVLPELLDALAIGEVVLVGHSDGASIALLFAAAHPSAVRALVLEAPHVFVEDLSVQSIAAIKREYETTSLRERMMRYHQDVDKTFYGWNDIWLAPEFRNWNIEEATAQIRAPLLAIQGLDDEYGTPAQIESIATRACTPVDRLLLSACGHAPHRDRADFVEDAIAAWLRPLV
jgi:pimeloyl-ACP methyl ester carboxylesterase